MNPYQLSIALSLLAFSTPSLPAANGASLRKPVTIGTHGLNTLDFRWDD